jgi:DUF2959 family protein
MRTIGIALALLAAAGCQSGGSSKAAAPVAETSASIQDISTSVTKTKNGVESAVTSLAGLAASTNDASLKQNFDQYEAALASVKSSAQTVRDHFTQLRLRKDAYLSRSLELSKEVKSAELRAVAEKRRTVLTEAFMTLGGRAKDAGKAFGPVLASLEDCQRFMEADFTITSAAALKSELEEIKKNQKELDAAADALVAELDALQKRITAATAEKK